MSQNWGSGSTQTGSNTSTTNKYFNPQAILDLTKYYGTQLGAGTNLNNSILYGSSPAPASAPPAGTTTPGTTTPAGGTTPGTTTPGTTTPAGGTTPPTGGTTPGILQPDANMYQAPQTDAYSAAPAAPTTATPAQIAAWKAVTPVTQAAGYGTGWDPAALAKSENDAALNYAKIQGTNAAAVGSADATKDPNGYVSSNLKNYISGTYGAQTVAYDPNVMADLVSKIGPDKALAAYKSWADQNQGNLYQASAKTHGTGDQDFENATLANAGYFNPAAASTPANHGEVPATANVMINEPGGGGVTLGGGGAPGLTPGNPSTTAGPPTYKPVTGNPGGIVPGTPVVNTAQQQPTNPPPGWTPPTTTTPTGGGTLPPGTTTPTGTTTPDNSSGGSGGLLGALQQLLAGGGYSDAEKQAITEKASEALAAQKGTATAQLANHLASSGNAAGYGGAMSSLDNSAAQTASDQARQNQIDFANEGERRAELGASGLTSLLGINTAAQLGTSGQAAGLASLGGGVDTSNQGGSSFSNQGFQATPDASANPGTKTPAGGTSSGKSGQDANGKKPGDPNYDPKTDPASPQYNPKLDPLNAEYDPYLDPKNKLYNPNIGTDSDGNHPGDPNYDPTTDKTSAEYDPTHDPNSPSYDPYYTPGGVLPDPNPDTTPAPGDTGGIEGDPTQTPGGDPGTDPGAGDVWAGPGPTAYSTASKPATYFSGNPNGAATNPANYIAALQRLLSM